MDFEQLRSTLRDLDQLRLLSHWQNLSSVDQKILAEELNSLPWDELRPLLLNIKRPAQNADQPQSTINLAKQATPPSQVIRQPRTSQDVASWKEAASRGIELLKAGRVAAIVVAGGQGTRLGFDQPKGMFPIGPISGQSLFQGFCEQILARSRQVQRPIPYSLMTSRATHAATIEFFEQNQRFGLERDQLSTVCQGEMPAIDAETGDLLLETPTTLCRNPDGHGGLLAALKKSGLIDQWLANGIETLFYHQVDNPATIVADPAFLGWHDIHRADVSTKVAAKKTPQEKMGAVVEVFGKSQIIEYSDLSAEDCVRQDAQGQPIFWAGNTAIHVFRLSFLKQLVDQSGGFLFIRHGRASLGTTRLQKPRLLLKLQTPSSLNDSSLMFYPQPSGLSS